MNRRGFLATLGLAAGALAIPELWTPKRTFFLPPRGGWLPAGTVAIQDPYRYTWTWVGTQQKVRVENWGPEVRVIGPDEASGTLYVEIWGAGGGSDDPLLARVSCNVDIQRA